MRKDENERMIADGGAREHTEILGKIGRAHV
jgi:hypothetical protein